MNSTFRVLLRCLAAALLLSTEARAQSPFLVRDIRPGPASGRPENFAALDGRLFFTATTDAEGREPWVSDGTESGTQLLLDARPGVESGTSSTRFYEFQGSLYFYADDGVHGQEVWRTDGTPGGTSLFVDFEPGPAGSTPVMRLFGGQLYIAATTTADGRELYTTDGTPAGTVKFVDINPGPGWGFGWFASTTEPLMIFGASDGTHGFEPWGTDGTPAGTQMLADCKPGPETGFASEAFRWNNLYLFLADDGVHGNEPWVTDGTPAGTQLVLDIEPGPATSLTRLYNSAAITAGFLFEATTTVEGTEPWITDGTPAGTRLLVDLEPGPGDSRPDFAREQGTDVAVFGASSPATGYEPWITDGTAAGTSAAEINPGPGSGADDLFFQVADRVFFPGTTPATGWELAASDGTPAGTGILKDLFPGSSPSLLAVDDEFVFCRQASTLAYSNGRAATTQLVPFDPALGAIGFVGEATRAGELLFVSGSLTNGSIGTELFAVEYDVDGDGTFGWFDELNVVPSCFCDSSAPCGNVDAGAGCANSTGFGARLDGTGTTVLTNDDLVLTVSGVPQNQFGVLFMGPSFAASVPLGDGLRCVSGALRRWDAKNAGATGELVYGPGLAAQAENMFPEAYHFLPGQTWSFQAWYRNPGGPCGTGSNVSSAARVTFTP